MAARSKRKQLTRACVARFIALSITAGLELTIASCLWGAGIAARPYWRTHNGLACRATGRGMVVARARLADGHIHQRCWSFEDTAEARRLLDACATVWGSPCALRHHQLDRLIEHRLGYPFGCVAGLRRAGSQRSDDLARGAPRWTSVRVLPLGAIGDVVLWSATCATLVVGVERLIRKLCRVRTRTGYCKRCGYDLRGCVSGRCSECGTPYEETTRSTSPETDQAGRRDITRH